MILAPLEAVISEKLKFVSPLIAREAFKPLTVMLALPPNAILLVVVVRPPLKTDEPVSVRVLLL